MASLFPHLTATGPPPTSREVMDTYRSVFAARVADGSLRPLVLFYHLYGYFALIAYLCIPHTKRPWVYGARWPVLGAILAFQWKVLWEATSMSMATGFAAGLMSACGAVWSVTWLVLNRPQFDAKRVQARPRTVVRKGQGVHADGTTTKSSSAPNGNGAVRKRKQENGHVKLEANGNTVTSNGQPLNPTSFDYEPGKDDNLEYYWQSYPAENLRERLEWVFDLVINFRMPGWNVAIPPLPSLPPSIALKLGEPVDDTANSHISSIGLTRYDTRRGLLAARLPTFIAGYFGLDILKTLMMTDPYFIFGPTTYSLPSHLSFLSSSPFLLKFTRQLLSSLCIILSLEMVFIMAPLGMSILLGPRILGQTAEAWYYPTTWGSWSSVMDKGLNGLWGSWWHQTFRFAFSAPTNFLIANGYIQPHTALGRTLSLLFAFGISGLLHAGGSISQFPPTKPLNAPIFFLLQALGITIQLTLCALAHPLITKFPKPLRQAGNFLFAFFWLFGTGHWLTDDFARGGIWLYEPIPISPLRGLGFGERDAGWWCWGHLGVGWYTGKHWWESGVAI